MTEAITAPTARGLEIAPGGFRDRVDFVVEKVRAVVAADQLGDRLPLATLPALKRRPWRGKGAWIFDRDHRLQGLPTV